MGDKDETVFWKCCYSGHDRENSIALVAIAIPLAKTERMREIWFFVMSCGALVKITVVEIARILLV